MCLYISTECIYTRGKKSACLEKEAQTSCRVHVYSEGWFSVSSSPWAGKFLHAPFSMLHWGIKGC